MAYTSQYPPAQNSTYVKATNEDGGNDLYSYYTTNPAKSLTGAAVANQWSVGAGPYATNRFHIDLGSAKIIRRIYYENSHVSGGYTNRGCKTFTFWGSNSATAFAELTYGTDTNWTQLTIDDSTLDEHSAVDAADPKYVLVTNSTAYRYYAFKFADDWGANGAWSGVRRIELQTEDGYVTSSSSSFFMFM